MSRTVPEWIGATPDTPVPPRVRLRAFERAAGKCAVCDRKIVPADKWQADHTVAIVNGGANAEANLRIVCDWCHKAKTAADVAEKSKTARVRAKHLGIAKPSRPMDGGKSSPWKRKIDGTVVRRDAQ